MHSLYAITLRAHFTHSFYPLTLYNNATLSFYAPTLRTVSTLCETAQRQQSPLPERPLAPRRRRLCLSRLWNFTLRAHVTHSFFALTLSIHFTQLKLRTHFTHSLYALTLRTHFTHSVTFAGGGGLRHGATAATTTAGAFSDAATLSKLSLSPPYALIS